MNKTLHNPVELFYIFGSAAWYTNDTPYWGLLESPLRHRWRQFSKLPTAVRAARRKKPGKQNRRNGARIIGTDTPERRSRRSLARCRSTCLGIVRGNTNRRSSSHMFCVDGLNGFREAIAAAYPRSDIQRCIIHQILSSTKYVNWKDMKAFMADLKRIYAAITEEEGRLALDKLAAKWGKRYP